nr:PAS domain S-box protein [uncultured Sphaerochaeta sp.]
MNQKYLPQNIHDLRPGDHLCCYYRDPEEHLALIGNYLRIGLEQGQKVIYVANPDDLENIRRYLEGGGMTPESYLQAGQLVLMDAEQVYLTDGVFEPDEILGLIHSLVDRARSEGYGEIRLAGEMDWVLKCGAGSDRLGEYEALLNDLPDGSGTIVACLYDIRILPPELLLNILHSHNLVAIGDQVLENIYYIPPKVRNNPEMAADRLHYCLAALQDRQRTEDALRASEKLYRLVVQNAHEGIFVAQDGYLKFVNDKVVEHMGYSREILMSAPWAARMLPDDVSAVQGHHQRRVKGKEAPGVTNYRVVDRSGNVKWMESRAVRIDWEGRPATLVFASDITKRRKAEDALRQAHDDLEKRVEERTAELTAVNTTLQREIEERTQAEEALRRSEKIMRAIGGATENFLRGISLGQGSLRELITRLGGATDIDRIYLSEFKKSTDGTMHVYRCFEWTAENPSHCNEIKHDSVDPCILTALQRWQEAVADGQVIRGHTRDLSEKEKDILLAHGIQSMMVVPVFVRGGCWGAIGLEEWHGNRSWSPVEVEAVKAAGTTLGALIERRLIEDALRHEEERFRTLVETLPLGLVSVNRNGDRPEYLNPRFTEIFGYTLADIPTGEEWFNKCYPDESYRREVKEDWLRETQRPSPGDGRPRRFKARCKDGSDKIIQFRAVIVEPDKMLILCEDFTKRIQEDEAFRETEEQYQQLVEHAPLALAIEVDGTLVFVNRKAIDLAGVSSADDLIGLPATSLFPLGCGASAAQSTAALTESPLEIPPTEHQFKRPDGGTVVLETTAITYRYEGKPANLILARDVTEKKRAEAALKHSEEHLRSLMENAVDFVIYRLLYDPDEEYQAKVVFASPSIREILGVSDPNDFPAWFRNIHPDDFDRVAEANQRGVQTFKLNEEFRLFNPFRKEWRWIHAVSTAIPDEHGQPSFANGMLVDITEQKRTEEMLRYSEARYKQILNHAPAVIFEIDFIHGRFTSVNEIMCRYTGFTEEELLKMSPLDLISKDSKPIVQELFRRVISGEKPPGVLELEHVNKKGEHYWVHLTLKFLFQKRRPQGASVVAHDITERKRAEEALRDSEKKHRELIEGLNEALFRMALPQGRVEYVSPAARMVFGFPPEEIMAQPEFLNKIIHPDFDELMAIKWREILAGKVPPVLEYKIIDPDGRERWIMQSNKCIFDSSGEVVALEAICRNETERKQGEEKLKSYQLRLRRMASELLLTEARERRRIAMDLHDDIGQSLAISKLKLKALQHSQSMVNFRSSLTEICDMVEQMIRAIRSLTTQLSPPILYELGLGPAVGWLAEQIQEKHGIHIEFIDTGGVEIRDEDIRIVLFRAVRELLMNIVKHAKARKARLILSTDKGGARIEILDDGVGFSPASDATGSWEDRGFGIFSIRERLEPLGGRLDIASSPGNGTRAILYAPLNHLEPMAQGDMP